MDCELINIINGVMLNIDKKLKERPKLYLDASVDYHHKNNMVFDTKSI
jgi:hypothetical protein